MGYWQWSDTVIGAVEDFLYDVAQTSEKAAHELIWVLKTEEVPPASDSKLFSVCYYLYHCCLCDISQPSSVPFAEKCKALHERILASFRPDALTRFVVTSHTW